MYLDEDDVAGAGCLEVFRDLREQRHHLKFYQVSITNPQHIYLYVCMYVCMYVCIYIYIYMYVYCL